MLNPLSQCQMLLVLDLQARSSPKHHLVHLVSLDVMTLHTEEALPSTSSPSAPE